MSHEDLEFLKNVAAVELDARSLQLFVTLVGGSCRLPSDCTAAYGPRFKNVMHLQAPPPAPVPKRCHRSEATFVF